MHPVRRGICLCVVMLIAVESAGCFFYQAGIEPMSLAPADTMTTQDPLKLHLVDGSTVVYRRGASVQAEAIVGQGDRYDWRGQPAGWAHGISRDSVVALTRFPSRARAGSSLVASAVVVGAAWFAYWIVAIYGHPVVVE